jgi:hypothetical protein
MQVQSHMHEEGNLQIQLCICLWRQEKGVRRGNTYLIGLKNRQLLNITENIIRKIVEPRQNLWLIT